MGASKALERSQCAAEVIVGEVTYTSLDDRLGRRGVEDSFYKTRDPLKPDRQLVATPWACKEYESDENAVVEVWSIKGIPVSQAVYVPTFSDSIAFIPKGDEQRLSQEQRALLRRRHG